MSHTASIRERYEAALRQNPIPSRMTLPNSHFVSNVLPGRTSSTTKRLKQLQHMLTPNEFSYYTKGFAGRQLELRTGFPSGRGGKRGKKKVKSIKRKNTAKKKEKNSGLLIRKNKTTRRKKRRSSKTNITS